MLDFLYHTPANKGWLMKLIRDTQHYDIERNGKEISDTQ